MTPSTLSVLVMLVAAAHQPPAAVDGTAPWRIGGLPSRFAHDLARIGSMPSIAILGAGGGAALAAHAADARSVRALSSSITTEDVLDGGATIGSAEVQFGIAAAVYGIGLAGHNGGAAETGSALLEAQLVQSVITQSLKHAVGRTRPNGGHNSLPSGHTASTFATADIVMQRFGWRAGAAAYAAAAYVGASRIAERDHYLSDTVLGAAIGIASARTFRGSFGHASVALRPVPVPGGGAVLVSIGPGR